MIARHEERLRPYLDREELVRLVADSAIDLSILERVRKLLVILFVAELTGSRSRHTLDALFLDDFRSRVCRLTHLQ